MEAIETGHTLEVQAALSHLVRDGLLTGERLKPVRRCGENADGTVSPISLRRGSPRVSPTGPGLGAQDCPGQTSPAPRLPRSRPGAVRAQPGRDGTVI